MGKRNFGLIGSVRADVGSIRVIRGMKLIEAAQKLDHRV